MLSPRLRFDDFFNYLRVSINVSVEKSRIIKLTKLTEVKGRAVVRVYPTAGYLSQFFYECLTGLFTRVLFANDVKEQIEESDLYGILKHLEKKKGNFKITATQS